MDLKEVGKRVSGLGAMGLSRVFGSVAAEKCGILVYHRIAPHPSGRSTPPLNVRPDRFRNQLVGLQDRGFLVWPLRKVLQYGATNQTIPPRTLVITFDDGFETVYRYAWPILQARKAPATIFLSTAYLDVEEPFPFDPWGIANRDHVAAETYRPLRTIQCQEMAGEKLIDLGTHTHTHQDFRRQPQAFRNDLKTSIEVLQSRFGRRDVAFAFPFGRLYQGFVSEPLVTAARRAGVICGLTTECDLVNPRSDPFRWGRFNVYDWDTAHTLAGKLEGWYGWAPRFQEWLSACVRKRRVDAQEFARQEHALTTRTQQRTSAARSAREGIRG